MEPSLDQASIHDYITSSTADTSADSSIPLSTGSLPGGPNHGHRLQPFNVSTRLIWNCAAQGCFQINNLTLCSTCKVIQYCGHAHLYADRPQHRSVCTKIRKAQTNLEKEEKALRNSSNGALFLGPLPIAWGTHPRRNYMRARYTLVERLLKVNTAQAVALSLEHLFDMLWLDLADDSGARNVVPALYLRLGRDQDAYGFCHWWATRGHTPNDTVGSNRESYFSTKNADIFEDVHMFRNTSHLSHVIAITLSKMRLIIDLQSLQRAKTLAGPYVPQEILEIIQQHSTLSAITNNTKITDREDHGPQITRLCEQVKTLFISVQYANRHFWPALVKPSDNLQVRPTAWRYGDEREMQVTLQHVYNAWAETPGTIDVIRRLLKEL
jgi:hypothetical protein